MMEQQQPKPKRVEVNNEEEWEVENIIDWKIQHKKLKYLISWKGLAPNRPQWDPRSNLRNHFKLINQFCIDSPPLAKTPENKQEDMRRQSLLPCGLLMLPVERTQSLPEGSWALKGGGKSYELIGLKQPEIGLLVHVTWEDLLSL